MNYFGQTNLPPHADALKSSQNELPQQNQNNLAVLVMIEIALAADFARFESKTNARALLSELQTQVTLPSPLLTRSASQPELRRPKISTSQSERKHTQKSQHSKPSSTPKVTVTKNNSKQVSAPSAPPKVSKEAKVTPPSTSISSKHKKKIHKVPEPKKEPARRALEPSLLETAQLPKMRLGEREKKKIRRLLLLRHVKEWNRPAEQRREGRQLRHQN